MSNPSPFAALHEARKTPSRPAPPLAPAETHEAERKVSIPLPPEVTERVRAIRLRAGQHGRIPPERTVVLALLRHALAVLGDDLPAGLG